LSVLRCLPIDALHAPSQAPVRAPDEPLELEKRQWKVPQSLYAFRRRQVQRKLEMFPARLVSSHWSLEYVRRIRRTRAIFDA
jgi:hypothetical protein